MSTKRDISDIGDIVAVLVKNSDEVVEIVNTIGLVNIIKSAPALFRIMKDIAERNETVEDAERALHYSAATKERVRAFQKKHGLDADGLVGNETWSKVEELLR